jgi:hypothetical protein
MRHVHKISRGNLKAIKYGSNALYTLELAIPTFNIRELTALMNQLLWPHDNQNSVSRA